MAETVTQLDPAMCKPKGVNVTLPPFLVEKFVTTHRLTAMWTEAFEECEYRELQTNTITIVHEHWTCVIVLDNGDQREFEAHTQEAKQYGIYWAYARYAAFFP